MAIVLLYFARIIAKIFLGAGILFLLATAVQWIAVHGAPYMVIGAAVWVVFLLLRRRA
ncbi:hypothetical protein FRACA_2200017 [Frankia canadensis]|uniref:Uncharacterized protein n=1 Tax=Frankia canadensis TaxID=1836972 RepID=A0A2I2KR28_9ACTN|nr:hypothetical protein [Frankia canadensis]SNQ48123.1 hypothetical protein FRACA_2200017 [Frankia canadensis]SOU55413.1 hypothetical protein FRACA_2200017 [Frankia canadensis]